MFRNRFLTYMVAAVVALSTFPAIALSMLPVQEKRVLRTTTPAPKKTQPVKRVAAKKAATKIAPKKVVKKAAPKKALKPAKKLAAKSTPTLRGVQPTTLRSGPVSLPKPKSVMDRALRSGSQRTTK